MLNSKARRPRRRPRAAVARVLFPGVPLGAALAAVTGAAQAQNPGQANPVRPVPDVALDPTWLGATAGSEAETYLRAAQVAGLVPLGTLSIRPLGPAELRALTARLHVDTASSGTVPARGRRLAAGTAGPATFGAAVLPATASVAYTTGYPFASGQGPVWEGRGATVAARAGVAAVLGPLTLVVEPAAFATENRDFRLTPNGAAPDGPGELADFLQPSQIDRPQRFGRRRYARLDPGNSVLRLDVGPVAFGGSTSAQGWGPAVTHPLLLGPNAGGFRHLFVGTSRPAGIGIGRLHLRSLVGRLDESPVFVGRRGRVASAAVAVFSPRGVPGLELGGARFYHLFSPPDQVGLRALGRPFEGIFINANRSYDATSADTALQQANQLASGFVSWTFPRAGVRAYGEFLRNDNPVSGRDLVLEPDHSSAYLLGVQRALVRGTGESATLTSVRAEVVNARVTQITQVRQQTGVYGHAPITQGHTQRGQLLGSVAAMGGAGSQIAVDRYARGGRWSLVFDRLQRARQSPYEREGAPPDGYDVQYAVALQRVWRRGPLVLSGEGTLVRELNRDFARDVWNSRVRTGAAWTF
jgi:hypothetical protein